MKEVVLSPIYHRGNRRIAITFKYDKELIERVKNIPGCRWSQTRKCWHAPDTPNTLKICSNVFKEVAKLNASHIYDRESYKSKQLKRTYEEKTYMRVNVNISDELKKKLNQFMNWMQNKRYSERTIQTYMNGMRLFISYNHSKSIQETTKEDIISFNSNYILHHQYSSSYQNQIISAIKLFFQVVESRHIELETIERPKSPQKLPEILSLGEIERLLSGIHNLKHKTMLSLYMAVA